VKFFSRKEYGAVLQQNLLFYEKTYVGFLTEAYPLNFFSIRSIIIYYNKYNKHVIYYVVKKEEKNMSLII